MSLGEARGLSVDRAEHEDRGDGHCEAAGQVGPPTSNREQEANAEDDGEPGRESEQH